MVHKNHLNTANYFLGVGIGAGGPSWIHMMCGNYRDHGTPLKTNMAIAGKSPNS